VAGSREYGSDHFIPFRVTASKDGTLAVRAGVGTGPYRSRAQPI